MRRTLVIACLAALIVAVCAGVASARYPATETTADGTVAFEQVPVAMPGADEDQAGAYGFRASSSIGADLAAGAVDAGGAGASTSGAAASVQVSAIVLPVVVIMLDDSGSVDALAVNTADRVAADVLYVVRRGERDGEATAMTEAIWDQARAAMSQTRGGTGTVWTS